MKESDLNRNFRRFNFDSNDRNCKPPQWFSEYWLPDSASKKHWDWQYQLAKNGQKFTVPEYTMRHPSAEQHQLLAKDFLKYVLEKYNDFSTVLDVGCSDGYMVKYFNECGKDAMGIDNCIYATDYLFIEENNLKVAEMEMHNMQFPNNSFDAVWCRHVLEHSFSPLQILFEIWRVLKKDGYLFCALPPPPQPPESYPGHWHQIPDYQLKYLLEMCNFKVMYIENVTFSYKQEGDSPEIRAIAKKLDPK